MKKLMILSLVLAIGAMSSAAVQLVPSAIDVMPGDVVTFQLIADFPVNAFGLQIGSDAGGVAEVGTVNATFTFLPDAGSAVNADGVLISGATGTAFGASVAAGDVIYDFTYTVPDVFGPVTISAINLTGMNSYISNAATFQDSNIAGVGATLNVIPEPMTMGLLGLGALFLRRRK